MNNVERPVFPIDVNARLEHSIRLLKDVEHWINNRGVATECPFLTLVYYKHADQLNLVIESLKETLNRDK